MNGIRLKSRCFALLLAALLPGLGGCDFVRDATTRLPGPRLYDKGAEVIGDIRAYARRIGFKDTDNFKNLATETENFPFCGYVSRYYLPYSYQDPAIRWEDVASEEACRARSGPDADVYFGQTEAIGESATPVTPAMLAGTLVRFVYLVLHEDCHDQFDLPQGIEEPLCNVIAYYGMAEMARDRDRYSALERVAMRRYAERESERTLVAKAHYERLEALYARYGRKELTAHSLLEERARIFRQAEKVLAWPPESLNNVGIANDMTYSRHFPLLESVFVALGRDVARTVAFFKKVDAMKPDPAAFAKKPGLKDKESLKFIMAYEAAVIDTMHRALAEAKITLPPPAVDTKK